MNLNFGLQNAIAAFVDTLRPTAQLQADLYNSFLSGFAMTVSDLLTSIGLPPR